MNKAVRRYHYSFLDILYLIFASIITLFYLTTLPNNPYAITAGICLALLFGLVFLVAHLRKKKLYRWLTLWYPFIFMLGIFETFFMIIPWFNDKRYDAILTAIDCNLLGVDPTVWMEQFHHPMITDLFYLLYFFYFPMELFILIYLYGKKKYRDMESAVYVLMFCNFGAYISYFIFPAVGPRFFLEDIQFIPLEGIYIAEPIKDASNFMEPNKLDVFPSLHTAILLVSLMLMFRYYKKMFYWLLLPGVGILISLVYCRYHYVIDMIVAVPWALFSYFVATKIFDKFSNSFEPAFYPRE